MATSATEPLMWGVCLVVSMTKALMQRESLTDEVLLCFVMLGVASCRASFLLASWPWKTKDHFWRLPNPTHHTSDPPGLFMSLLLMPLLCLAIGYASGEARDDSNQRIWCFYALFVGLSSYVAWEDSLWRHGNSQHGWKVLMKKALIAVIVGNIAMRLCSGTLEQGFSTTSLVLVFLWHGIYHSMQDFLPTSFHGVFTQGEWMVVTSLLAVALAHYFKAITSNDNTCHRPPQRNPPNHATVAIAGLISAALTCPIMTMINGWWIKPTLQTATSNARNGDTQHPNDYHGEILSLLLQLPLWVGIPLAGVELLAFKVEMWLPHLSAQQQQQSLTYVQECGLHVLLPAMDRVHDHLEPTMATLAVYLEQWNINIPSWCIPQAIHWLFQYLLETEQPLVTTNLLPTMPRYGWLLYWLMVLALTIPFSPEPPSLDNKNKNNNVTNISSTHAIVLARKWFHGIAVLLFAPVTLAAPKLLSLSYAIALAILMLLESARTVFPTIQQFHQRYLDPSKDAANGLVISHMALILGCALPLWISELIHVVVTIGTTPEQQVLLQLWGVLSLGIGDAMGAIVGVVFGRTRWSRNNSRTLEGSVAVWVSLYLSCGFVYSYCGSWKHALSWRLTLTVTLVTLLEAYTSQIDNLVLPLAGATLLLVLRRS
jgi:dolichol kinase